MKKLCIIGCGGFIGSHLVERFLKNGRYYIYGIDISEGKIGNFLKNKNFHYLNIDVNDIRRIRPSIEKSDCIISLAALCSPSLYNTTPLNVLEANFLNHLKLVNLCCRLKKWLIHFSTCEVYGKTISSLLRDDKQKKDAKYFLFKEDTTPFILGPVHAQRWIYACAKQLLERVIYAYDFEKGLDYTIIRPFNFIGPRMDYIPGVDGTGIPRVLACFISSLLFGKPLELVDGGRSRRSFTYISDAVDAIELILKNPGKSKGEIFNIGNPDNEVAIKDLALLMIKIYKELRPETRKSKFSMKDVSSGEFYGKGYEDSDRRMPDISKASRLLGWKPRTGLEPALRETIRHYLKYYLAKKA